MPPIFGILNTKLKQPDPEMIRRMKGAAMYVIPGKAEACEVDGGIMAAAVIPGNPLHEMRDIMAVEGPWGIVADVGLYNRDELSGRLGRPAFAVAAAGEGGRVGDAQLILESWLKWGKECVNYLYGDFAFVIFNHQTGKIFCGRDKMGVRPFFYRYQQNVFVFGSELRYVLASSGTRPALRHEYLLDTLVTVKTSKELSPFENIFRLKPGHYLHCSEEVLNTSQYWKADTERTIHFSSEEDYIALFREKLINAVNMRCAGVRVPGAELSGGLDSSAVAGIALDYTAANNLSFTSFSNIFPKDTGIEFKDEQEFISAMKAYKPHNWFGIDQIAGNIPELLQYTNDIQGCFVQQNYNVFNRGIYEAAGKQGIQALLSGFGGDELVSARIAMPWNELIRDMEWKVIQDELFYKGLTIRSMLKPGLIAARYLKSLLYHPNYRTGVFTPELLDRRFDNLPLKQEFTGTYELRKRLGDNFRKPWRNKISLRQYDRIMLDHLPQRMEYCYTAAAQYGMEYRYPLLDVDLMETCLAFPPWVKQHHGINRYIFRQAIKAYVPEEIRLRDDKSGTTIPQMYFSLLHEKDLIPDMIRSCSDSAFLKEIFDFSRFPQWYERQVKRDKADMNYLMPGAFYSYLMIMLYFKKYG